MNRIHNAIELLEVGIEVGDEPECKIMQEVIDILSEPGDSKEQIVSFESIKKIQDENKELQAETKAKDESHKNEIFKLNDMCVAKCKSLRDENDGLKAIMQDIRNSTECQREKRILELQAENDHLSNLIDDVRAETAEIKRDFKSDDELETENEQLRDLLQHVVDAYEDTSPPKPSDAYYTQGRIVLIKQALKGNGNDKT